VSAAGLRDQEFETFYRQQSAALTRWLIARGADPADAADATQDALTQAWLHWPRVTSHQSYLYRVAGHEMGRIWHARRQGTRLPLPARQRAVLAGYYDGYRDAELAPMIGIVAATIRSDRRHARAGMRALTELLEQDPHGLMLRRAYTDMRDGDPCPAGARPLIARSWSRSAQHLPDPGRGPALPPLTDQELGQRRAASPLAAVSPDACSALACRTGLLTVITDPDGRVLWRAGDHEVLQRGESDGHGDGACLAEHAVGTSGVSLALAAGHPVIVSGPEHYFPAQHDLICAGAPLRHPADGRLLGTICISAPWRAAHSDMLKLIDQTATQIRQQLTTCPAGRATGVVPRLKAEPG
jgi:DNA-directed RNA polymerase specialized sigma24 family protein